MENFASESTLSILSASVIAPKAQKKAAESAAIKMLPKFIEACLWRQSERMSEAGESIAAAIEMHHPAIALKIRNVRGQSMRPLPLPPLNLIAFDEPRHGLSDVILPDSIDAGCRSIIQEHQRRDDLAAYSLSPRHKVLLHGDPGNGKTMLAEALAFELGVPFLRIKYSGLIESYMGNTGKNIETIMEYAKTAPCLVFLDEFDGVGMDRNGANNDVGEMRRITNQLLISLDRLPASCVFVAATNCPGLVDPALKRRFDLVLELPAPTIAMMQLCANKELSASLTPGRDVTHLAKRVAALPLKNLFEVVEICRRIRRDLALNEGIGVEVVLQCPEKSTID